MTTQDLIARLEGGAEAIWNAVDDWGPFAAALPSERADFANTVARAALLAIVEAAPGSLRPYARLTLGRVPMQPSVEMEIAETTKAFLRAILNEKPGA